MAERTEKLVIGPRLRRLRETLGLTQAQMADDLGVSPSYVNLIERNQRPISAKLLLKLTEVYDFELSDLAGSNDVKTVGELYEIARDPVLELGSVAKTEVEDVVAASPDLARAFVRLYEKYRDISLRSYSDANPLADREKVEILEESARSVEAVREFFHQRRNYFPDLEAAATEMADEMRLHRPEPHSALTDRLREKHGLTIRIVPADVMKDKLRYFDRHRSGIDLSELLPQSGRRFQMAFQLGMLEHRTAIDQIVKEASLADLDAVGLLRVSLANYFAAALLMPYDRFLQECERTKYDIELLSYRFRTSYEQTAHRLTTLQKPDARGVPFFFVRLDTAGNVSKRFSAGRFHFSKFGGACPLWNIHECFQTPGKILPQVIQMPDDTTYFSIARTVSRNESTYDRPSIRMAVGLGCDIAYAPRLVYARNFDLMNGQPTPIGVNCYLCERPNCPSRAHAPLNKRLSFDERARGISIYKFDGQ